MMTLFATIALAGCKGPSSLDKLTENLAKAKGWTAEVELQFGNAPKIPATYKRLLPNHFAFINKDAEIRVNPSEGYLELLHTERLYDGLPWTGQFFAGTERVVGLPVASASLLLGASPKGVGNPKDPWTLKSEKGLDTWTKMVETMQGKVPVTITVDAEGNLKKFTNASFSATVKSISLVAPKESEFAWKIPDGYTAALATPEFAGVYVGKPLDISKLTRGKDVATWKPTGNHLFAVLDPSEPTSQRAMKWIATATPGYTKMVVTQGNAATGFSDPKGITKGWATSSPFFILVDAKMNISGLWLGFDANEVSKLEKEIRQALLEKS